MCWCVSHVCPMFVVTILAVQHDSCAVTLCIQEQKAPPEHTEGGAIVYASGLTRQPDDGSHPLTQPIAPMQTLNNAFVCPHAQARNVSHGGSGVRPSFRVSAPQHNTCNTPRSNAFAAICTDTCDFLVLVG